MEGTTPRVLRIRYRILQLHGCCAVVNCVNRCWNWIDSEYCSATFEMQEMFAILLILFASKVRTSFKSDPWDAEQLHCDICCDCVAQWSPLLFCSFTVVFKASIVLFISFIFTSKLRTDCIKCTWCGTQVALIPVSELWNTPTLTFERSLAG